MTDLSHGTASLSLLPKQSLVLSYLVRNGKWIFFRNHLFSSPYLKGHPTDEM